MWQRGCTPRVETRGTVAQGMAEGRGASRRQGGAQGMTEGPDASRRLTFLPGCRRLAFLQFEPDDEFT